MKTTDSITPTASRNTHDFDLYDQIQPELRFLASALNVISTVDIAMHAEGITILLDRLGETATAVCDAVKAWYESRPTGETGVQHESLPQHNRRHLVQPHNG